MALHFLKIIVINLNISVLCYTILSLTVEKEKNRCDAYK